MNEADVLIIGAGAAGLAAAYELSLFDKKIIVLEARDRIGGRIHTIKHERFEDVIEAGAEFIHGNLPFTIKLLKKAALKYHHSNGKMWQVYKGELEKSADFIEGWGEVMKRMKSLNTDMPFTDFLQQHFSDEKYNELKESLLKFVEGYDAADASKASTLALKKEWENDDDKHQGRIDKGYIALLNFLAEKCKQKQAKINLSSVVTALNWSENQVEVITSNKQVYKASKAIITIPLGVWQAEEGSTGSIIYTPDLGDKKEAAKKMGYGSVIKFNFQFSNRFWEEDNIPHQMENAGFIFSDAAVPTWWTQKPNKNSLLTGWLAGPKAFALKDTDEEQILKLAVDSLAYIFKVSPKYIQKKLTNHFITNWTTDVFSRGAYSYATLDTNWAKKVVNEPVQNTLYFAGEALYKGTETGTVEGALVSGRETVKQMIGAF